MSGLYLHIPFCVQKCHYCNFVITLDRREEFRERFFKALEAEMQQAADPKERLSFDTLYLGGGTPSLLSGGEMRRLFKGVHLNFEIAPSAEVTCEFNPGDADAEKIAVFRDLGVNRVSLGVQAFQDPLLKKTGRKHSVEDTYETVRQLRTAGIHNLSFDLISGLPGQTYADFKTSLEETIRLGASQLSFYDLEIHENTPWGIEHKKNGLPLLNDEERSAYFQLAVDKMTSAGYLQYEISTFAKPGFESRHNLKYWNNQEYLGLGPGAYSYKKGVRSQFAPDMGRYLSKCETGDWAADLSETLSAEEKETETLITGLRLPAGVDLTSFPLIGSRLENRIRLLRDEGFLSQENSNLKLTERGRALVESTFRFLIGKDC